MRFAFFVFSFGALAMYDSLRKMEWIKRIDCLECEAWKAAIRCDARGSESLILQVLLVVVGKVRVQVVCEI